MRGLLRFRASGRPSLPLDHARSASQTACSSRASICRLPDGFVVGVEQRHGLGAIPRAGAFLLVSFRVFEVEHAAALAAAEDEATFHNFGFFVRKL